MLASAAGDFNFSCESNNDVRQAQQGISITIRLSFHGRTRKNHVYVNKKERLFVGSKKFINIKLY